jgi:catechol 2,3-dioxygenase-like lactoylglutathione lyase family enzyme
VPGRTRFTAVVPILNVRDVEASLRFYVEVLAFERPWWWGDPPTFGGAFAGDHEVQFCQDGQGAPGTWISVWVDDVDALHERLLGQRVDIRQAPSTFPWGVRELNVADPDGHRIRFSTASRGPVDDVAFPD